jgi:hypothetical protein
LSFSLAQAGGGLAMALLAPRLASYQPLFLISALALIGSVIGIAAVRDPAASTPPRG